MSADLEKESKDVYPNKGDVLMNDEKALSLIIIILEVLRFAKVVIARRQVCRLIYILVFLLATESLHPSEPLPQPRRAISDHPNIAHMG